jgi:hypothetical protein
LDTNAGSFFVLTTNLLRKGKTGFVFDNDPRGQVWNQPAWKYEHTIAEGTCPIVIKNPAKTGGALAHVVTDLHWIAEKDASETPHGNANDVKITRYEYCVELDENRRVIGGEWISYQRPDFMWMAGKPDFSKPVKDTQTGKEFDLAPVFRVYEKSRKMVK